MKPFASALILICCATALLLHAKSPTQLKSDLAGILPAGKKARMAWVQGGMWKQNASTALHAVDSEDGVVRKLTGSPIHAENPHVTADGARIVFGDKNSGRVYVIDWDGNGASQRVVSQSGVLVGYWQDPKDGSHWAIIGNRGSNPIVRVNLDDTKKIVTMWDGAPQGEGSPLMGISRDGTRLAGFFNVNDKWTSGTLNVTSQSVTASSFDGCGMGMAPDNSYDYFVHWGKGHDGIRIINGKQSKDTIRITDGINAWAHADNSANENTCHDNDEYNNARWTNDRDYITFSMFNTRSNPFLFRLSDKKWISIQDGLGCGYADGLDVRFLPKGATAANRPPVVSAGKDTTVRVGWPGFRFAPAIADDGLPSGDLTVLWTQVSGPSGGVEIRVPDAPRTLVDLKKTGSYVFRLAVGDGELIRSDDIAVTVIDALPFKVLSPAAGDRLILGERYTIRWQADPPDPVLFDLTTDNGKTFVPIQQQQSHEGSWVWDIPSNLQPSNACRIRMTYYFDRGTSSLSDTFVLAAPATSIGPWRSTTGAALPGMAPDVTEAVFNLTGKRIPSASAATWVMPWK